VGLDVPAPQNGSPAPGTIKVASAVETAASVENRGLPPVPSPEPAAAQPTVPEAGLPDFAKKADDLESIRKAVDDAVTVGGALWFSYLFVLFYLAVAAGAVTHADLFLENPVKLPFLNIDLPLLAFFSLAPILFLFAHGYTLMHLVMLTEKAKDYDQALREQIGTDNPVGDKLRRQLPSNIFIQYLAGPANLRKSAFGYALGFVAWTTLAVAPVLLLLMMQLQFLPFHSLFIAWTQRIVLVLDLALIWWLWGTIRSGRETGGDRGALFWAGRILSLATGLALTIDVILFSAAVATFPGEWQEDHLPSAEILPPFEPASGPNNPSQQQRNGSLWDWARMSWDWVNRSEKVSLHDWIFNSPLDDFTRHRLLPFANTLVLIGFNVLEGLHLDDPKKEDWRDFVFRARGRDLVGANFDFASLPRVDFTGAHLENAFFDAAQLDRVSFDRAHLQDASFDRARLQGASFDRAQVQGASFYRAQLQGATLDEAQLQGASFDRAQLQGAKLERAQLQAASLRDAQLQGASLRSAQVQGALLFGAQLQGAGLDQASLQGAGLAGAQLQGASLFLAELQGASLAGANLDAADLSAALLWRADGALGSGKNLELARAVWGPFWIDFTDRHVDTQEWSETAYQNLRKTMEAIPGRFQRGLALAGISRLDCADPDKTFALAPCDPGGAPPPPGITGFQAAAGDEDYRKALAGVLKSIICAGDDESIFVLRGVSQGSPGRLKATGTEGPALIDFIMSPACPVSAKLTDDDKARLQKIKADAPKPPPPPQP
jgi:uncharacterized protein YjbI with pentapeptide repeats